MKVETYSNEEFEAVKSDALPRGYLSASQIQKYLTCPADYEFTYIKGNSFKPNAKMVQGTIVHKLVEKSLILMKGRGFAPEEEEILDSSRSVTEAELSSRETSDEVNLEAMVDSSQKSFRAWYKERMHLVVPIAVEQQVLASIGDGIPLKGYIDYIDGAGGSSRVVDLKVGMKRRDPCKSLQLGLYALMTSIPAVAYDTILQPTKRLPCRVEFAPEQYEEKYLEHIGKIVERVYEGITSGYFPLCLPDNWACSPTYCSNYERCRG